MRLFISSLLAVLLLVTVAAPAGAHDTGAHYPRAAAAQPAEAGEGVAMAPVKNLPHQLFAETNAQNGSDIEFLKVGDSEYALAGTLRNGLQIVDITDPTAPAHAALYDCPINQGDVQVFRQSDRILATYVADSTISSAAEGWENAACIVEANAKGAEIDGSELGTFLVDLTDPTQPATVSFIEIPKGSHNQTVHPSGDYLYNSNSDLVTTASIPQITITDISDPENPRHVQDFTWEPRPGLGSESHDIFFNANGTRAYTAAVSSTLILDTSDPEAPEVISQTFDGSMEVVHQSDIVSLPREDGSIRTLMVITDEQGGAAATVGCPGGGLHIYDITGDLEASPQKLGTWWIDHIAPQNPLDVCTSHVLRFYPHQGLMTIAWYTQGVRVVDISGLAEAEADPEPQFGDGLGMKEVGNYVFDDADTWAFKTNRIEADGSLYGYGNDMARGLDVYRFDGAAAELGRTVPVLEPEDMGAVGCTGIPVASAYVDRDEARDAHERSIDCVISRAIALGAVQNANWFYQPLHDVTREQMASFIVNALRAAGVDHEWPEAPAEDKFTDIADSAHKANINLLAEAGIVSGVSAESYDPSGLITRAQMATFMVKAAAFAGTELAESGGQRFSDVEGNTHAESIEIGSDHALFSGTATGRFSPARTVARDQMASFLTNLLVFRGGPLGPGTPAVGGMPR